ncbi:MAG: glycine oxidase ThiO [Alteromonadaceae bacterium]
MTVFEKQTLPTKTCANIIVIGAGLVGRLIALSLINQGHQVTLIDKDNKQGHQSAAYAAAGLLTPLGEAMHAQPNIVEMGFESLKLWPKLLAQLEGYTYFQQAGALMVSHEQDQGDYQRFVRYIKNHYPQHQLQQLNRQQILELEPELGRSFNRGLFLPEEGQIGNRKLLIALQQQLEKSNLTWLDNSLVINIDQQVYHCLVTYEKNNEKHVLECDLAIDCRGAGARSNESKTEAAPLQDLRGVRGELFQLFAPDVHLTRPIRLMHPRYQLYIAPKTKGFYVVGATEIESEDCGPMTVRSSMELLSAAYSVHPGFSEANIRQHIVQLRPAFSDNQPKILVQQRLIQVNGLFRHGFLIAPVVLKQLTFSVNQLLAKGSMENSPYGDLLAINKG